MIEKKNILFYSISLGGGGAQRQIVNIINKLDKEKYDITVFIRYNDTRFLNEDLLINKVICFSDRSYSEGFLRSEALFELISLFKIVKKYKIDVIYARGHPFFWKAAIVKKIFRNLKLVSVESNYISQIFNSKAYLTRLVLQKLCRFALLNSDLVYCLTKANKDDLLSTFKISEKNVKIFPVVFDIKQFQNIQVEEDTIFDHRFFNISCLGRFVRQKNHLFLIDTFNQLTNGDYRLHIFGEGELEASYVKRINQLNLKGKVLIHHFSSSPYSIIQQSDLVVFPSLFEGFGNVLLESIFCETPIVVTNFYGIDQRIKNLLAEIELIVEPGDFDGLVSRINYVRNNYSAVKQNIIKIKSIITEEYSLDRYVRLFEKDIDQIQADEE
jgi:glycosyltransferase involved in cell wall biosynthesis